MSSWNISDLSCFLSPPSRSRWQHFFFASITLRVRHHVSGINNWTVFLLLTLSLLLIPLSLIIRLAITMTLRHSAVYFHFSTAVPSWRRYWRVACSLCSINACFFHIDSSLNIPSIWRRAILSSSLAAIASSALSHWHVSLASCFA